MTLLGGQGVRGPPSALTRVARELLVSWARKGAYVFGGERPYASIKTAFRAACRRAGLAHLRFHDLRHTWATGQLVLAGVDLRTVQELGGWSSLSLVERYSHPTPEAKRRAIEILGSVLGAQNGHQMDTFAEAPIAMSGVTAV